MCEKLFGDILHETTRSTIKGVTDDFIKDNLDEIKASMTRAALVGKTEYNLIIDSMFDEWAKSQNSLVDYEEVDQAIYQELKLLAEADGVSVSKDEYDDTVIVFQWSDHLDKETSSSLFGGKLSEITRKSIDFLINKFSSHLIDELKKECMVRAQKGSYEGYISIRYILREYLETDPERISLIEEIYKEYRKYYTDYILDWCNKNRVNIGYNASGEIKLRWEVLM